MKGIISKAKTKAKDVRDQLRKGNSSLGDVESVSEPAALTEATRRLEVSKRMLSECQNRYARFVKTETSAMDDLAGATQSLKEYAGSLGAQDPLAQLAQLVSSFDDDFQRLQRKLADDVQTQLVAALDGVLAGDVAEAEFSKKRYNGVLQEYDAINDKVQKLDSQGAPLQKMLEAQKEQERLHQKFTELNGQTMDSLRDVNQRVEFSMFQTLTNYLETYQFFFTHGQQTIAKLMEDVQRYRAYSEEKRNVYESGAPMEMIMLRGPSDVQKTEARDPLERAFNELLERERKYVRSLASIVKTYVKNIRVDDVLRSLVSEQDMETIFSNLEDIIALHRNMLDSLEQEKSRYPTYQVGKMFLKMIPQLSIYHQFIRNHSKAINCLDLLEGQHQPFRKFMKTMDRKNGLRGLLAEPLSRIPSYALLLNQLLQQTSHSSDEHFNLSEAVEKITALSSQIQDSIVVSQNIATLLPVWNLVEGFPDPPGLIDSERTLQHQGMLTVRTIEEGKVHDVGCYFFLFSDMLLQVRKKTGLSSMKGKKYVYVKHWSMAGCNLTPLPDSEEQQNAFEFQSGSGFESCCLLAGSPQMRTDWISRMSGLSVDQTSNPVFEVTLEEAMRNQRNQSLPIPEVVDVCCEYLMRKGLDSEGLFRLSGLKREISKIISMFNRGVSVSLETETQDEHTVAGVLKRWVRMTTEPLLTFNAFHSFLEVGQEDGPHYQDLAHLQFLINALPETNKLTLKRLFGLLHQLSLRSLQNKMDANNIGIVFAPGLLRERGAGDFDTDHYDSSFTVVGLLVSHYGYIFTDVPDPSSIPASGRSSVAKARPPPPSLPPQISRVSTAPSSPAPRPSPRNNAPKRGPPTGLSGSGTMPPARRGSSPPPMAQAPRKRAPVAPKKGQKTRGKGFKGKGKGKGGLKAPPPSRRSQVVPPSVCAGCGEAVEGAGLQALGGVWHSACWKCTHCGEALTGKVLQREGQPYCEADYRTLFKGRSSVRSAPQSAERQSSASPTAIATAAAAAQKQKRKKKPKICHGCNDVIEGKFMRVLGQTYHAVCFVCEACGGPLNEGYIEIEEKPYCSSCV